MMKKLLIQFVTLVYFVVLSKSENCELKNVEILELPHFQNNNFTNIHVSWEISCKNAVQIKVNHLNFMACNSMKRDYKTKELKVEEGNSVIVENLHHYSNYKLSICILPDCSTEINQNFTTKESVPRVKVRESLLDYDHKDTERQLTFNWRPPLQSQCDQYQSDVQYYHFKLVCLSNLDRCRTDVPQSGSVPLSRTEVTIKDLVPNTCYAFFVFVTNSEGDYHHDFYVKLEKCTKKGELTTPTNLTVNLEGERHHVFWNLDQENIENSFTIRWTGDDDTVVTGYVTVNTSTISQSCHFKKQKFDFCVYISSLEANQDLDFSIQSVSLDGLRHSTWSKAVFVKSLSKFDIASPGRGVQNARQWQGVGWLLN